MLHIIMPNQVSGPNNASRLISNSFLKNNYEFGFLTQKFHAGGKINFSLIHDLKRQIINFDPDIIHLSGLQNSAFHGVIAARLAGKEKILIAVRGSSRDAISISKFQRFIFANIIEPITLKLSHSVYTVSRAMADRGFVKKFSKNFIGTIHNPAPMINLERIRSIDDKLEEQIKGKIVVSIVGRIVYDKGVTFIAEAIRKLNDKNIIYLFIGDGGEIDQVKSIISINGNIDSVLFLGHRKDVLSILQISHIFLFATLHENLSNALLEACSLGLGIIATDVGGNPEVIRHKENGLLIPSKDADFIADAVKLLSYDKELRNKLGNKAKENIEKNFSQKKIYKMLESIYQGIL